MYTVDSRDVVEGLADIPRCDVGAPMPCILAAEGTTLVAFFVQDNGMMSSEHPSEDESGDGEPMAIVRFTGVRAHIFGPPNDEAFEGHPLASRGLHPYGAFRVHASSWIRALERMNAVHPAHRPEHFGRYSHFVLSFHDSTFECVATKVAVHPAYVCAGRIVEKMAALLREGR